MGGLAGHENALVRTPLWLLGALAAPALALASGYAVPEQGAKASGLAGAWLARADDAAANWYNPAALVWLEESEVQFGTNLLFVGDMDLRQSHRVIPETIGGLPVLFDEPIPATYGLADSVETPVHLYLSRRVNDRVAWGIGINNPFGLVSDWRDRPVTFAAARSELLTVMVNPNVAFRVGRDWSVAVGIDYVQAELTEFSAEIVAFQPVFTPEGPALEVLELGRRDLTGEGDDLSWNLAVHRRGDPWSFGLTYRAELAPSLEGELRFSNPLLPAATGRGSLHLPARAATGVAWDGGGEWACELDVEWTDWSVFDELRIAFDSPLVPDIAQREDWSDALAYRLGIARRWATRHEGRAGIVFDEAPGPPDTLRPTIPDTDRTGVTLGYGFTGARWSVDAYYMALFFAATRAVPGEEGVIGGEYEGFGNIFGLTVSRRF